MFRRPSNVKLRPALAAVADAMFVVVAGVIVWQLTSAGRPIGRDGAGTQPTQPPPPLPAAPIPLVGAHLKGTLEAPVALVIYSDFQCPYCRRLALDALPEIEKRYVSTGKVVVAFRHFPLPSHASARLAAEAAACAGDQDRFWDFHDALFRAPDRLERPDLVVHASALGLNVGPFEECLSGAKTAVVSDDLAEGRRLAVGGTPTTFVGIVDSEGRARVTQRLTGALAAEQFAAAIDRATQMSTRRPGRSFGGDLMR